MMPRMDAVVVSDYAKGFATAAVVQGIIAAAQRHGKPVVVDPKGSDFERYRGATVIKPNRKELAVLTGLPARHHEETMHAARQLLRLTGCHGHCGHGRQRWNDPAACRMRRRNTFPALRAKSTT